jgi:WD40 repeat protein
MVATADKSNDNNITIWNMNSGEQIMKDKTGGDPINDMTFTKQEGKIKVWSSGPKGCFFMDADAGKKKKCLFGKADRTGFACITSDDQGNAFAGAANSLIYKIAGNSTKDTFSFHERGFIGAIVWISGMLYSGGRDGRVNVIDASSMEVQKCIDFGCLPRAIDIRDGELVVGLKTGAIVQCNLES